MECLECRTTSRSVRSPMRSNVGIRPWMSSGRRGGTGASRRRRHPSRSHRRPPPRDQHGLPKVLLRRNQMISIPQAPSPVGNRRRLSTPTSTCPTGRVAAGAPILCDSRMVANGITRSRLPAGNDVVCTLDDPAVPELARKMGRCLPDGTCMTSGRFRRLVDSI